MFYLFSCFSIEKSVIYELCVMLQAMKFYIFFFIEMIWNHI